MDGDGGDARREGGRERLGPLRGRRLDVELEGLPPTPTGFFALHLHENPCGSPLPPDPYTAAGGHYNPMNRPHPEHAGDFPPVLRLRDGTAALRFITDRFRLVDAIGRSVMLHLGYDDFTSQPAGNAGMRLACGVVQATPPTSRASASAVRDGSSSVTSTPRVARARPTEAPSSPVPTTRTGPRVATAAALTSPPRS